MVTVRSVAEKVIVPNKIIVVMMVVMEKEGVIEHQA